jgi:hypothetical protein
VVGGAPRRTPMPPISEQELDRYRKMFVGKKLDTVKAQIEDAFETYELHIVPEGTAFTMVLSPDRVKVYYDEKNIVTKISNG